MEFLSLQNPYLWLAIAGVGVFVFLVIQLLGILSRKKKNFKRSLDFIFLEVKIPKKESKEDMERDRDKTSEIRKVVAVGEDFMQTLYGIFDGSWQSFFYGEDFLSFEYVAIKGQIYFIVGCPRELKSVVGKQITAFYPDAVIDEKPEIKIFEKNAHQISTVLTGGRDFFFPFKTYKDFESTDPINNILNSLSNVSDEDGSSAVIQIMIRPKKSDWQADARAKAKEISSGKKSIKWYNPISILRGIFELIVSNKEDTSNPAEQSEQSTEESQEVVKIIEEKADKNAFETIIRLVASSPDEREAKANLQTIKNAFVQFGTPSKNSFSALSKNFSQKSVILNLLFRNFKQPFHRNKKLILAPHELASVFHFPHTKYNDVPGIKWQNYKIAQAPNNVPKKGLYLGENVFRGKHVPVYMDHEDRFRHFYVIGQTGTGKSSIFQVMIRQDLEAGRGMCVVDPHGSLVDSILPYIPKSRIDDVIIFDPADLERPMGLNLLEAKSPEEADMIALDAMNIMIKIFDEETFGPRIQDYFRNGCLTLMSDPEGGCLTDMMRLFTDNVFQQSKIQHIKNPVIKSFWTNQMASTGQREQQEIVPYFAAKFGQFTTNSMMRNIIGQTKSAFDFSQVMNEGKILLMNLSKGLVGDINSKLLGLLIVNKIQMAALRRQKDLSAGKKPADFFLYIDEFQNYVTDSIESILSEARKYRLSLNIAHQYIGQIDQKDKKKGVDLKDAVFGNVGTMMCYKIGAQDSEYMSKEMAPVFSDQDLINIDGFKAAMKLCVEGKPCRPFTLNVPRPWLWGEKGNDEMSAMIRQISRLTYGRNKKYVEKEIYARLNV